MLAWGIVILVLVDGVMLSFDPQYEPSQANDKHDNNRQRPDGPVLTILSNLFNATEDIINEHEKLLIVLSTVAIAAFTYTLWRATGGLQRLAKKQATDMRISLGIARDAANASKESAWAATKTVKEMRRNATHQLRAYVFVDSAEINYLEIGGTPEGKLTVRNFGQTPAYGLNVMGGIAVGPSFDALPPGVGPAEKTVASLAPGAFTWQFHKAPTGWMLTQEHMTALQNGDLTLWVYGEMRYKDAFECDRITRYRFQTGGTSGMRGNRLAASQEGNEET
jgi:hypothetical protein